MEELNKLKFENGNFQKLSWIDKFVYRKTVKKNINIPERRFS